MGISTRTLKAERQKITFGFWKFWHRKGAKGARELPRTANSLHPDPALSTLFASQLEMLLKSVHNFEVRSEFILPVGNLIVLKICIEKMLCEAYSTLFWFVFQLPIANPGVLGPYAFLLSANLFVTSLHDWILALNWMVGITNSSCQFFKFTMHDGSSGKIIAMFYVMWWWYHSTGWSRLVTRPSFKGLFRLVEFCEFFLQGSEWRRGERLRYSKMSLDNVCGKGRELACTPSILSTG